MTTKKAAREAEQKEAQETLRQLFAHKERKTVYTVLRHVSQSGMSRDISLKMTDDDGRLLDITYTAAKAMGENYKDRHGQRVIRVNGCGMDMGFHLVYGLSYWLYKDDNDRAGYVLNHEWA
jgi:hypothetical protein